jgi:hypothetical protein
MGAIACADDGDVVTIKPPTRSGEQNSAMWPILDAFAEQLPWPVNGKMCKLTAEEFKDIMTAGFEQEHVRLAMGLDGGVVMLGLRTSTMSKKKFSEFLEFLHATAIAHGVNVYENVA